MRISRLTAGLVTAGLIGFVPIAVSAPADAATTVATTTVVTVSDTQPVPYGEELSISSQTLDSTGASAYSGTSTLQVYSAANPVWTTIATDDTPGYASFDGVLATATSQYRVLYGGYANPSTSSTAKSYTASESAPVGVSVVRNVKLKTSGLKVIGKVSPLFSKEKVKVLKKVGKKYKKYTTVKSDKKGKFSFRAPRKNKFRFALVIPGDAQFAPVINYYIVHVY